MKLEFCHSQIIFQVPLRIRTSRWHYLQSELDSLDTTKLNSGWTIQPHENLLPSSCHYTGKNVGWGQHWRHVKKAEVWGCFQRNLSEPRKAFPNQTDPKVVNHYKWPLEQKTLEKRRFADCNLVFRPSLRSSLTPVIIPASSQNMSLPSSNHSNSTAVEKIACFCLVSPNDQYSSNTMNNKDTPTDFSCHPCRAQFLWFQSYSFH